MILNEEYPKPLKIDKDAPESLEVQIKDPKTGKILFSGIMSNKHFKTGSVGYFAGGKIANETSGERYQFGCNITLIGSKQNGK
jgi:hypothetical protein